MGIGVFSITLPNEYVRNSLPGTNCPAQGVLPGSPGCSLLTIILLLRTLTVLS